MAEKHEYVSTHDKLKICLLRPNILKKGVGGDRNLLSVFTVFSSFPRMKQLYFSSPIITHPLLNLTVVSSGGCQGLPDNLKHGEV